MTNDTLRLRPVGPGRIDCSHVLWNRIVSQYVPTGDMRIVRARLPRRTDRTRWYNPLQLSDTNGHSGATILDPRSACG